MSVRFRTVLGLLVALTLCAAPALAQNMPTVIHPGDQLSVQVFGDQSLTQNVTVLQDGTVAYPLIGQVPVAGKTPEQAAAVIREHLLQYVRHPIVTIAITQFGQPDVMVLGDVKTPGKYQLPPGGRLTDAIAAAGGIDNADGDYPVARISTQGGRVENVSLQQLLRNGDVKLDVPLAEGDVVYVPGPVQFSVNVTGAVDHPGQIEVNEGDTLAVAIAKAGDSANAQSDLNHVRLIRNENGKEVSMEVNLYKTLQSNDPSSNVVLKKGDTIYVPQATQHHGSTILTGVLYALSRLIP